MSFIFGVVVGYAVATLAGPYLNPLLKQAYDAIMAKIKGSAQS